MPYNAALPPENTDPWYTALITNWLGGLRTFVNGLETSLGFKADTTAVAELARDALGTAMESANGNLTIVPNDAGDKIVFTVSGGGGGGITLEEAVDTVAAAITVSGATGLTKTYDDAANGGVGTITLGVTGAVVRAVQVVTGSEARPSGVDTVIWVNPDSLAITNKGANDIEVNNSSGTNVAAIVDAKGDLLVASAADTLIRFPVGANGKVLKADSSQTSGLIWADDNAGSGGGGATIGVTPAIKTKAGNWFGPFDGEGSASYGGVLNRLELTPFYVHQATPIDRIAAAKVDAGSAGGVIRLGLYNSKADGMPGTVRLDAGTAAADTAGIKEITISTTLTPGLYYLAGVPQVALANTFRSFGQRVRAAFGWDWDQGYFNGQAANSMNALALTGVTGALPDLTSATLIYLDGGLKVGLRAA